PIAAAKRPLSGRTSTATPARNPVNTHHNKDLFVRDDLKARVVVNVIAAIRKVVSVSVKSVAAEIATKGHRAARKNVENAFLFFLSSSSVQSKARIAAIPHVAVSKTAWTIR